MENMHLTHIPTGAHEDTNGETELDDHNATINPQEYMEKFGDPSANVPWCVRITVPILFPIILVLTVSAFVYGALR